MYFAYIHMDGHGPIHVLEAAERNQRLYGIEHWNDAKIIVRSADYAEVWGGSEGAVVKAAKGLQQR